MRERVLRVAAATVVLFGELGWLAPTLISAKSTLIVLVGLASLIAAGAAMYWLVNDIVLDYIKEGEE